MRGEWKLLTVGAVLLAGLAGCSVPESRTANQGGGSLVSGGAKVAAGNIGQLTPDEWQILCDNAPSFAPTLAVQYGIDLTNFNYPVLSDEEAQAIADYLAANNIQTLTQLQAAYQAGTLTPPPQILVDLVMPYINNPPPIQNSPAT